MQQTIILCPLYNDEASFALFAAEIEKQIKNIPDHQFSFLVVNDGTPKPLIKTLLPLSIVHLSRNLGHQKAIAIGLAYAHHHLSFDQLIVMDCDGEDQPGDIQKLLQHSSGSCIVVASRASRQEGKQFQLFYKIYQLLFRILTGKKISFGNFMLIPSSMVGRLIHYSEIWNHLAGSVIKSGMPMKAVSTHRGKRYEGRSKMSFTSLFLHGLGAIGVFTDIIASRLLLFSMVMIFLSLVAIVIIVSIKLFTDLAIPGWATGAVSSMLIVLLQSFLLSLFTIFLHLSSASQRRFIPALHYEDYVQSVETPVYG
ncbi:MAG: glycosyltransferase [Flavisolibacter sp.]